MPLRSSHAEKKLPDMAQLLKTLLLQATGARPGTCAYCGSIVAIGETRCGGCGAKPSAENLENTSNATTGGFEAVPILLCFLFPPALFFVIPALFWRWLRRADRGWVVPLLICIFFPPAALLVAPALLLGPRTPSAPSSSRHAFSKFLGSFSHQRQP
jgi:hypothetical protein